MIALEVELHGHRDVHKLLHAIGTLLEQTHRLLIARTVG